MTYPRLVLPFVAAASVALAACASPPAPSAVVSQQASAATLASAAGGRNAAGVVYVTDQSLYYDTFVVKDPLPMHGRFQPLYPGAGPGGVSATPYGPGDPGYLGGRWWVDTNGDGMQDSGDHYFLCPLLGPGRPTP